MDPLKILLLLRHGKSSWNDPSLDDHDRPLKKRGRRAATRIGEEIVARDLVPDRIVSSTARRASQTARRTSKKMTPPPPIVEEPRLYFEGPRDHLEVLASLGGNSDRILLVGHNPNLEELVHRLTGELPVLPTAALVCIDLEIESWTEAPAAKGRLRLVVRPRELDRWIG